MTTNNIQESGRYQLDNILYSTPLSSGTLTSSGTYYIDDMLVFNNYIHYAPGRSGVMAFNPQASLQQSIVNFNIYSLEYR